MKIFVFILSFILFVLLTIITQVGGVILLLSRFTASLINKKLKSGWAKIGTSLGSFIILYTIFTWLIIPPIARSYGKVPLPAFKTNHVQPLNILTVFLNRHYVKKDVLLVLTDAADELDSKYPGSVVNYLDAGFPFLNGFPLLPHLSHNDGKKLDISFRYTDSKTGEPVNNAPAWLGYGICEEPTPAEINTAVFCAMKGYRQYSVIQRYVPQGKKEDYKFDAMQTKTLIRSMAANPLTEKIFIEPHLQTRMNISNNKVRFQGCHSVRHDDHIHLQVK